MSVVLLIVVIFFGLICLALGVMRFMLNRSGITLSAFLGTAAALCLGYVVVAGFFTRQLASPSREPLQLASVEPAGQITPLKVPDEIPLIDLSEEVTKGDAQPDWVNRQPVLAGDLYTESIASDPKLTAIEAQADLAEKAEAATMKYIANLLDEEATDQITVDQNFIAEQIQKEVYLEQVDLPVGTMMIAHGRLEFDKNLRDEFRTRYQAAKIRWRMTQAGGLAGLVLLVLGTLFGYLKLDTATRGYYSGRLQLTAGVLILAVAWAGYRLLEVPRL